MNKFFKLFAGSAVAISAATVLPSCSMEEPFKSDGEGVLSLNTEINGNVVKTRASVEGEELELLKKNCIVYIENGQGVIRKFKDLSTIPQSIKLQTGSYVAEAWSGDSVSASFTSKFYRGYQKFDIQQGQNTLTLNCNIANVLVSVDPQSLNVDLQDLKVTFSHTRGELEFTAANIPESKGYFMMPDGDNTVNYKIEGKKSDGSPYSKEGKIEDVKRAHEYNLLITEDKKDVTDGGALIQITIADIPLIEEVFEICPGPSIRGVGFDIDRQVTPSDNGFSDTYVMVKGYEGLSSILLTFNDLFTDFDKKEFNLLKGEDKSALAERGITCEEYTAVDAAISDDESDIRVDEIVITFSKAFLSGLEPNENEYTVKIDAIDTKHREGSATLRIAASSDAVEVLYPVETAPAPDYDKDPLAVGAHQATLTGIVNDYNGATNYGIEYCKQGTSDWKKVYPDSQTRAASGTFTVTLTGLEAGTTYEYRSFCDEYTSTAVMTFKTEEIFKIPNASFEEWGSYKSGGKTIILPGNTGDKLTSYWGSGNEGSATVGYTLTDKSTDMVHSGEYSACLQSKKAVITLAAGNIFIGEYARTDGTNGVLNLGREYNGSHPTKVKVYCNYRPGKVDIVSSSCKDLAKGDTDQGQIYVALTSQPMEVRTKDKYLVTPDREEVIAYGEVTLKENYGPDNQLQELEVKFNYNDKAKTQRPTHLVIVATAAKFGDYFSGSSSSVMYVDDFELVYE